MSFSPEETKLCVIESQKTVLKDLSDAILIDCQLYEDLIQPVTFLTDIYINVDCFKNYPIVSVHVRTSQFTQGPRCPLLFYYPYQQKYAGIAKHQALCLWL